MLVRSLAKLYIFEKKIIKSIWSNMEQLIELMQKMERQEQRYEQQLEVQKQQLEQQEANQKAIGGYFESNW